MTHNTWEDLQACIWEGVEFLLLLFAFWAWSLMGLEFTTEEKLWCQINSLAFKNAYVFRDLTYLVYNYVCNKVSIHFRGFKSPLIHLVFYFWDTKSNLLSRYNKFARYCLHGIPPISSNHNIAILLLQYSNEEFQCFITPDLKCNIIQNVCCALWAIELYR